MQNIDRAATSLRWLLFSFADLIHYGPIHGQGMSPADHVGDDRLILPGRDHRGIHHKLYSTRRGLLPHALRRGSAGRWIRLREGRLLPEE